MDAGLDLVKVIVEKIDRGFGFKKNRSSFGGLSPALEWTIIVGDWSVPKLLSSVALVVAGGLALLGLRLSQHE